MEGRLEIVTPRQPAVAVVKSPQGRLLFWDVLKLGLIFTGDSLMMGGHPRGAEQLSKELT
jgi:hypothetical protein